jgi:cell division protein ZapE
MSSHYGSAIAPSVRHRYGQLAEKGELTRDPAQERAATALDRLISDIASKRLASKSSSLGWLFGKKRESVQVTGLYIYGGVGTGKTMLMDMFFALVPAERKRRAHFNDFMADVHDRIGQHRQSVKNGEAKGDDPIPPVARALAEQAWVLCFDEFTVTDIADAMILSRLFSALFDEGVVLVATSNVAPEELYRDGLNRGLFLPFVEVLKKHTNVLRLDAATDYRMEKLNRLPVYLAPLGPEADARMDEIWATAASGHRQGPLELTVKGRVVHVPVAADGAARFSFADLCEKPLGARDYLAIAARFKTVFIEDVPVMGDQSRNEAKRFILLIDTLYDNRVHLVMSAAATPDELYTGKTGTEAFEFARTASRLWEMQSHDWFEKAGGGDRLARRLGPLTFTSIV